jgi:hypothetical protein
MIITIKGEKDERRKLKRAKRASQKWSWELSVQLSIISKQVGCRGPQATRDVWCCDANYEVNDLIFCSINSLNNPIDSLEKNKNWVQHVNIWQAYLPHPWNSGWQKHAKKDEASTIFIMAPSLIYCDFLVLSTLVSYFGCNITSTPCTLLHAALK